VKYAHLVLLARGAARFGSGLVFAPQLTGCTESVVILESIAGDGGADAAVAPAADGGTGYAPGSALALAASGYTCAVDEAGLWCWGTDDEGALPLGAEAEASPETPRHAVDAGAYVQLCNAEVHSCGLRRDGEIECWGSNDHGQLGLGHDRAQREPAPLATGLSFVSVACGGRASCAVADSGSLYCWGDNSEGLSAQGDAYGSPDVLAPSKAALDVAVRQVSVGQGHACAVAINGALYCWGRNTDSQLGIGATPIQKRQPTPVDPSARYHHVAAGQQHSCAIRSEGSLYCWGRELAGRLGLGALQDGMISAPKQVGTFSDYVTVAAHWFHACARRLNGRLLCWGRNEEGQLGVGHVDDLDTPTVVSGPSAWTSFAVGRFHTCGLTDGQVFCWGMNDTGALGLPQPERQKMPAHVTLD
jgi:alpha-tubulin suppressor-like RCC1 family protein